MNRRFTVINGAWFFLSVSAVWFLDVSSIVVVVVFERVWMDVRGVGPAT